MDVRTKNGEFSNCKMTPDIELKKAKKHELNKKN